MPVAQVLMKISVFTGNTNPSSANFTGEGQGLVAPQAARAEPSEATLRDGALVGAGCHPWSSCTGGTWGQEGL